MRLPDNVTRRFSGITKQVVASSSVGVLDAAIGSIATFIVGAFAAVTLEASLLGIYALAYAVYIFIAAVPYQLIFTPTLAVSASVSPIERSGFLRAGLKAGFPAVAGSSAAAFGSVFITSGYLSTATAMWLGLSIAVATAVHGPQVFTRQMFHFQGRHVAALTISATRLVSLVLIVALLTRSPVPPIAVPLLALGVAGGVSLLFAIVLSGPSLHQLNRARLYAQGKYLVGVSALPALGQVVVSYLIIALASPEALGYAEAARIIAQPVLVAAIGLDFVTNPPIMTAVIQNARSRVSSTIRRFIKLLILAAAAYTVLVHVPAVWSSITALVPAATHINGLVLMSLLAAAATGLSFPYRGLLIAAAEERAMLRNEIWITLSIVLAGLAAPMTASYTRPLSNLIGASARLGLYRRTSHRSLMGDAPDRLPRS